MLTIVPAGVLLSVTGVTFLWQASLPRLAAGAGMLAGASALALGGLYALLTLARGSFSGGAAALIAGGAVTWMVARQCGRRGDWRPAIVALLLAMPIQFTWFAMDYFGDYRARSAARYEYNVRGAIEQMIALHDRSPGGRLYLNTDVLFIGGFWDYYLRLFNRPDLRGREIMFDSNHDLPPGIEAGSLILTDVNDRAMSKLGARADLVQVARATDPVPGTTPPEERTSFVIFQKR
jgi:hypothetical protein